VGMGLNRPPMRPAHLFFAAHVGHKQKQVRGAADMRQRRAFTLVELLVVVAIIAVLLAILLPSLANVKNLARRLQCSFRLKEIGHAYSMYQETYNGDLPTPEQGGKWIQHYFVYRRDTSGWSNMGCLFAAGFIQDGRTFYCPATEGWLEEYRSYCNPTPWGTLPQNVNNPPTGNGNQWVRAHNGYAYWPQSKDIVKTNVAGEVHHNAVGIYQVGYPKTPLHVSKLLQTKAFASDLTFHAVKGSGWNMNAVFPDGHVSFQMQPKDPATERSMYFRTRQYPGTVVDGDTWHDTAEQSRSVVVTIAEFMFALQP
jgi:prepilin-type N-terminal cleavage/methylation domain-containing protein